MFNFKLDNFIRTLLFLSVLILIFIAYGITHKTPQNPHNHPVETDFQLVMTLDSIEVWDDDIYIGTVPQSNSPLDSLLHLQHE